MECEDYSPDIESQGDCRNCGHSYRSHHFDRDNQYPRLLSQSRMDLAPAEK